VLSAQAEAEKLTARSASIGAKTGGESGEPKAHSEVSPTSDASLASGAVGELGSGMLEAMPDYAREAAEGIGSDGRGADSGLLVREAARLLSSMLAPVCTDISLLCGGVIIASLFRNVCREGSSRTAVSYAVTLGMAVPSAGIAVRIWSESAEAIENLTMYMRAVIPVMGSLYCAGGNVGAAAASSASLTGDAYGACHGRVPAARSAGLSRYSHCALRRRRAVPRRGRIVYPWDIHNWNGTDDRSVRSDDGCADKARARFGRHCRADGQVRRGKYDTRDRRRSGRGYARGGRQHRDGTHRCGCRGGDRHTADGAARSHSASCLSTCIRRCGGARRGARRGG
jgi:hypothetical protein